MAGECGCSAFDFGLEGSVWIACAGAIAWGGELGDNLLRCGDWGGIGGEDSGGASERGAARGCGSGGYVVFGEKKLEDGMRNTGLNVGQHKAGLKPGTYTAAYRAAAQDDDGWMVRIG